MAKISKAIEEDLKNAFPYHYWFAKTQTNKDKRLADMHKKYLGVATSDCRAGECVTLSTPWHENDLMPKGKHMNYVIMDEINEPPPARFWECEYCGTVNPIDTLDCRAKACGHSITRKAMEAAFGAEKTVVTKVVEQKQDTWNEVKDWLQDGDSHILIGSNSSSSANITWDTSGQKMTFRGGTIVARIGNDGAVDFGA
jgi:hypothetical protein